MAAKYRKREDGRYQKRVRIGTDKDGKAIYKHVYAKTIKELEVKAKELERDMAAVSSSATIYEWGKKWFKTYKSHKEYNTVKLYERLLNKYIYPELGEFRLVEIRGRDVQELINKIAARGTVYTAKMVLMTVKQIYAAAMVNEMCWRNPAVGVDAPKHIKAKKSAFNAYEDRKIKSKAPALELRDRAFLFVLYYTGIRRGEIIALNADDVDLEKRRIYINKTVVFMPDKAVVKERAKSEAGMRDIIIVDKLAPVLAAYLPSAGDGVLFPDKDGGNMSLSRYRKYWDGLMDKLGFAKLSQSEKDKGKTRVTAHKFRHNFASVLNAAGVDVKAAQKILGHADPTLTMKVYTHLTEAGERKQNEKVNRAFK